MGIVNVTPDSFSDGGLFAAADAAIEHGLRLVDEGADVLDVGGESSRPGAEPVPAEEERRRVLPVVEALARRTPAPISVDTCKAEVARAALEAGAHLVNDITALGDPLMGDVVRQFRAGVILMHMQGTPATMQLDPHYDDVVADIASFFQARLQAAAEVGIAREQTVLDPGIGFGKRRQHNLEILARLHEFQRLGRPVCLGVSRKGFIDRVLGGRSLAERLPGSLACACHAVARGAAHLLRVHEVRPTRDAAGMLEAIEDSVRGRKAIEGTAGPTG
jgi:dihydropteroate synthase